MLDRGQTAKCLDKAPGQASNGHNSLPAPPSSPTPRRRSLAARPRPCPTFERRGSPSRSLARARAPTHLRPRPCAPPAARRPLPSASRSSTARPWPTSAARVDLPATLAARTPPATPATRATPAGLAARARTPAALGPRRSAPPSVYIILYVGALVFWIICWSLSIYQIISILVCILNFFWIILYIKLYVGAMVWHTLS